MAMLFEDKRAFPGIVLVASVLVYSGCGGNPQGPGPAATAATNVTQPVGKFIYVPTTKFVPLGSPPASGVYAFAINPSNGTFSPLPGSPFPTNTYNPSEPVLTHSGMFLYVASEDMNITEYSVEKSGGALQLLQGSPYGSRSQSSNGQSIVVDDSDRFLYTIDSGGARITGAVIDPVSGALSTIPGSTFQGPAGIGFYSSLATHGSFLYASMIFGIGPIGAIDVLQINGQTGALTRIAGSPFPGGSGFTNTSLLPSGVALYGADYGTAHMIAFSVDTTTGALGPVDIAEPATGQGPGRVVIDPHGRFVYVPTSGPNTSLFQIYAYSIDSSTLALTPISGSPFSAPLGLSQLAIDPSGSYLYGTKVATVMDPSASGLVAYSINAGTGALTPVANGTFVYPEVLGPGGIVVLK